jgi:hypothetical protein
MRSRRWGTGRDCRAKAAARHRGLDREARRLGELVDDSRRGAVAAAVAAQLTDRLDLRLVLAHVVDGAAGLASNGDEALTTRHARAGGQRLLDRLAAAVQPDGY